MEKKVEKYTYKNGRYEKADYVKSAKGKKPKYMNLAKELMKGKNDDYRIKMFKWQEIYIGLF